MRVSYYHERRDADTGVLVGYGFVIWTDVQPFIRGQRQIPSRFPTLHPASPGTFVCRHMKSGAGTASPDARIGCSKELHAFRKRGYSAGCLTSGEGIKVRCLNGQDATRAALDLAEVFGWRVQLGDAPPVMERQVCE